MNIQQTLATIAFATALAAGAASAADSTAVVHGSNYDPVRHERMQTALRTGDTATVNSIRAEQRAKMKATHGGGAGMGQGQGMGGGQGQGKGKGKGGGQCHATKAN